MSDADPTTDPTASTPEVGESAPPAGVPSTGAAGWGAPPPPPVVDAADTAGATPRWRRPAVLAGLGIVAGFGAGLGGAVLLDQVTDGGGGDRVERRDGPAIGIDERSGRAGTTDGAPFDDGWGAGRPGSTGRSGPGFGSGQDTGGRQVPGSDSGSGFGAPPAPNGGQSGGSPQVGGPGTGRSEAS